MVDNKNYSIASNGDEIITDTPDELVEELQREAFEQQRLSDDKTMNSIASNFKQCKRDFETLKTDYTRAISDKVVIALSRIYNRALELEQRVNDLNNNVPKVELDSNSMWRQLMQNALNDFAASIEAWRTNVSIIFNQLKDGVISWADIPCTITEVKNDAVLVEEESSGNTSNHGNDKPTSGSGDSRESHLFTNAGRKVKDAENVTEVTPVVPADKEESKPVEPVRKTHSIYSLDYIRVADLPVTAGQLKLLGYLRRSANAIIGARTRAGSELYYIGSITNNLIIPDAYHNVEPIFDTAWGTYFLCTVMKPKPEDYIDDDMSGKELSIIAKYVYLNHSGVVEEIAASPNSHRFIEGSGFILGDREEAYPESGEDYVTDAIFQSGQLVWVQEGNIQYLINSELGTVLGYSVSVNLNEEGYVKLSGVSKFFLSRLSLNTIILRDVDTEKEEYVSMKAKLVFDRNADYVSLLGGIVFIGPNGTKTTVSTFVPYEVEFGNNKSLLKNNYIEFSNGVLFIKDKILFTDSGNYITQISLKDLEQGTKGVVSINDTLFITDKVGSI